MMMSALENYILHFCHVILFELQVMNVLGIMHRSFTIDVQNDKCIHLLNYMWL